MEQEIYSKKIDDTEFKLVLEFDKPTKLTDVKMGALPNAEDIAAMVSEYPDRVTLSISSPTKEQHLKLDGGEYRELRDLLMKDHTSGRYVGGIPRLR